MGSGYDREMYQELYAIRARMEDIHAIQGRMDSIESNAEKMLSELVKIRRLLEETRNRDIHGSTDPKIEKPKASDSPLSADSRGRKFGLF